MIDILYISHQSYDWKKFDTTGLIFLDQSNLNTILNDPKHVSCYSTIEDLAIKINGIDDLVAKCNRIELVQWDQHLLDRVQPNNHYLYFGFLHFLQKHKHQLPNNMATDLLLWETLNANADYRKQDGPNLWVGGCSFSFGLGVPKPRRYANLLAERLGLPLVMLARSGSSISWQADQWLRSDLRPGDIAIWGLTNIPRIDVFKTESNAWESVTIRSYLDLPQKYRYWSPDYFDSLTQSVGYIKQILQVENFFKKVGIEYYLVNFMDVTYLPVMFKDHCRFLDLTKTFDHNNMQKFLDYAADQQHPGVLQHQSYCQNIHDFLQTRSG